MAERGNPGWQPGKSGNPGGRSKDHKKLKEIITLEAQAKSGGSCAKYFVRKLIDFIEFADTHKVKLEALKLLMAYRYGNPSNVPDTEEQEAIERVIILTGVPEPKPEGSLDDQPNEDEKPQEGGSAEQDH